MSDHIKHLIECQCVLNIFKNKTRPVFHKFKVFSQIDENDSIKEKYVICNNEVINTGRETNELN